MNELRVTLWSIPIRYSAAIISAMRADASEAIATGDYETADHLLYLLRDIEKELNNARQTQSEED